MANSFEKQAENLFQELGLAYYPLGGQQILLRNFHKMAPDGDALEFDGMILSGRICVFVELTTEKRDQREKIRRFLQHARWIESSSLPMRQRFSKFKSIPHKMLGKFEDVNEWRYLYIGTSPELREKKIGRQSFPDVSERLGILWDEDWAYLKLLSKSIGSFAVGELFAALNLHPGHPEFDSGSVLKRPFITLDRKILAHKMPKADLFVAHFSAQELLAMCRVLRYQRLPMAVEPDSQSNASTGYQRLLGESKLTSIREHIHQNSNITFPNSLTLVSNDCYVKDKFLHVPFRYASLDVIDGQHRLFAYASASIKEATRTEARLLTTIIKFDDDPVRSAAQVFITINKNQAKVKRELIVLTSYDAMNGSDGEAVAGKVLCVLNEDKNFALFSKLRTRPMIRAKNTLPIVTIALELARLLESGFPETLTEKQRNHFLKECNSDKSKYRKREERLRVGRLFFARLFNYTKTSFKSDFDSTESNLLSPIYIACFIRLGRDLLVSHANSWEQVEKKLASMSKNATKISRASVAFPRDNNKVPERKSGMKAILEHLKRCL